MKVTLTFEGGNIDQVMSFLGYGKSVERTESLQPSIIVPQFKPSRAKAVRGSPGDTPQLGGLDQYRNKHGGVSKLNVAGMEKIWELHREGYSTHAIARAFSGLLDRSNVRRLIQRIKNAKEA